MSAPQLIFTWTAPPDILITSLDEYDQSIISGLGEIMESFAGIAQGWMQGNAPWNDQSGAARAGLRAVAESSATNFMLHLMHSVYYGPFLEFGTYKMSPRPILGPAQATFGPQIMAAAQALIGG